MEAKTVESVASAKIQVPIGQEWFWVDTLQASRLFTQVGREDYHCTKPTATITVTSTDHPAVPLPAPAANVPPGNELEDVIAILKKKYPKPSEVKVLERHQNLVKVEISGLRGNVLSGHNFWERLEIYLVHLKPGEAKVIVEGEYVPGMDTSPPAIKAYESMEKEYYKELLRFTQLTFASPRRD